MTTDRYVQPQHSDLVQGMTVHALLDDLDIAGCRHCEELRYQLIDWLQAHSDRYAKQRRVDALFDLVPNSALRKRETKAEALV